jgi:hypothetical protein
LGRVGAVVGEAAAPVREADGDGMADGLKVKNADGVVVIVHADEATYDGTTGVVERTKLVHGPPGSITDVSAASPLEVTDAALAAAVTALATVEGGLATQATLAAVRRPRRSSRSPPPTRADGR